MATLTKFTGTGSYIISYSWIYTCIHAIYDTVNYAVAIHYLAMGNNFSG